VVLWSELPCRSMKLDTSPFVPPPVPPHVLSVFFAPKNGSIHSLLFFTPSPLRESGARLLFTFFSSFIFGFPICLGWFISSRLEAFWPHLVPKPALFFFTLAEMLFRAVLRQLGRFPARVTDVPTPPFDTEPLVTS